MAIDVLHIEDFQCHKIRQIKLDPGITTLVGPTDAGKSSVLRALRWICLNGLGGDEFIREGADGVWVELDFDDGQNVKRAKDGSKINTYALNGEEYKAFGQGVPDAINKTLRLSELNFQEQHDAPFWFSATAGEVSRSLNAIIDLSIIDDALAHIASQVRTAADRVNMIQERLDAAKRELADLEPQRERVENFWKLQQLSVVVRVAEADFSVLNGVVSQIQRAEQDQSQELYEDRKAVWILATKERELDGKIYALGQVLEDLEMSELAIMPPPFEPVADLFSKMHEAVDAHYELKSLLVSLDESEQDADEAIAALKTAEEKFHSKVKGQRCPTCLNVIK